MDDFICFADSKKDLHLLLFAIREFTRSVLSLELKEKVAKEGAAKKYKVDLKYITARGNWYHSSWKGDLDKSGGIATNIGIHFFDLLLWIFGDVKDSKVSRYTTTGAAGSLSLDKADISWDLSIDENKLPVAIKKQGKKKWRSLVVDGKEIPLNDGFDELHTQAYKEILNNKGIGLEEAGKAIALAHQIRNFNKG